jgi:sec-independent protein translocase protein TatB
MLGIGTPELLVIGLVLLMLYGPDRLPKMLAKVTGFMRDVKDAGQDVSRTVQKELYKVETQVQTLAQDEQAQPRVSDSAPPSPKKDNDAEEHLSETQEKPNDEAL